MPSPTASRYNGRSTVRLTRSTDFSRHCATTGHETRKAVAVRITTDTVPRRHTRYKPECAECSAKALSKRKGVVEIVTRFA